MGFQVQTLKDISRFNLIFLRMNHLKMVDRITKISGKRGLFLKIFLLLGVTPKPSLNLSERPLHPPVYSSELMKLIKDVNGLYLVIPLYAYHRHSALDLRPRAPPPNIPKFYV